jgi:rhodanese-related sulfurtransferase
VCSVIRYEELKRLLADPSRQIVVVDTSTADEFKARRIPGSYNVPGNKR